VRIDQQLQHVRVLLRRRAHARELVVGVQQLPVALAEV